MEVKTWWSFDESDAVANIFTSETATVIDGEFDWAGPETSCTILKQVSLLIQSQDYQTHCFCKI